MPLENVAPPLRWPPFLGAFFPSLDWFYVVEAVHSLYFNGNSSFLSVFSRVHATLYVTMSVRLSVRPSVGRSVRPSVGNHFVQNHFFGRLELNGDQI